MTLVRQCRNCKSTDIRDELVVPRRGHGGSYWSVKCHGCRRVLTDWDVIDVQKNARIAVAGSRKATVWAKGMHDYQGRLTGRDREGMAL